MYECEVDGDEEGWDGGRVSDEVKECVKMEKKKKKKKEYEHKGEFNTCACVQRLN
jgi:hypothetical protein